MTDDDGSSAVAESGDDAPEATRIPVDFGLSTSTPAVTEALAALDPVERDLIRDAFRGAGYRKIAADRGLSEATVKSTVRRGLNRIVSIVRQIDT